MKLDDRTKNSSPSGPRWPANATLSRISPRRLNPLGIETALIEEAIDAGKAVRTGAASSMDRLASQLTARKGAALQAACSGAGCSC
jgi:hypothetical protein